MNNRKIAEMLLKVEMDDLTDAEMLAGYAHEASVMGDTSIAAALAARAKQRLSYMEECKRSIETVLKRIEAEGGENADNVYKELLERHIESTVERIHSMLAVV